MRRKFSFLELIMCVLLLGLLSSIVVLVLSGAREDARRTSCHNNLRALGCAMFMYADVPANGGMFPTCSTTKDPFAAGDGVTALNLLYRGYVNDPKVFSCPSNPRAPSNLKTIVPTVNGRFQLPLIPTSLGYDPGHNSQDKGVAIASDQPENSANSDNHGPNAGQNVLLGGGEVEWRSVPENVLPDGSRDGNIFGLNPEIPRNKDGYIRP